MRPELAALFGGGFAAALLSLAPPSNPAPTAHAAVMVLGHDALTATVLYAGMGVRLISPPPPSDTEIVSTVRQIGRLDPDWQTPWAYGALVLDSAGSPRARPLLLEASVRFDDEHWFPARLGLLALRDGDRSEAVRWLRTASHRPDAPAWCGAAAARLERP